MTIKYICPHCKTDIGEIMTDNINEYQLGLHFLTPEERKDIITYNPLGNLEIRVSCQYCRDAVLTHPELALLNNPLQ